METTTNAEGDDEVKKLISVSLRPDDPFAKRLLSTPVRTNNLLLKVTVPRRTGRKRKRGTSGPFLAEDETGSNGSQALFDAPTIHRSLQDNVSTYKVAIAGVVDETHRFRSKLCQVDHHQSLTKSLDMPDMQYNASHNDTMVALRDHVLSKRCKTSSVIIQTFPHTALDSLLKDYSVNTEAGADLAKSVGPSPEFLQMPIAFNYRYNLHFITLKSADPKTDFSKMLMSSTLTRV